MDCNDLYIQVIIDANSGESEMYYEFDCIRKVQRLSDFLRDNCYHVSYSLVTRGLFYVKFKSKPK